MDLILLKILRYKKNDKSFWFNLSKGKRYLTNDSRRYFFIDSNYMITFGIGDLIISNHGVNINFPWNYVDNST